MDHAREQADAWTFPDLAFAFCGPPASVMRFETAESEFKISNHGNKISMITYFKFSFGCLDAGEGKDARVRKNRRPGQIPKS